MSDTNDTGGNTFGRGEAVSKGPIIPKSANEALRPERVPQPPRRSRKARSQLVIFLNFVMTAIVFITTYLAPDFGWQNATKSFIAKPIHGTAIDHASTQRWR